MLINHLHRIAVADQDERRAAVLAILDEMDATYAIHRETVRTLEMQNIVISFHAPITPRLVIGAHYDSVPGSTGANDNAAGVCVLLALLQRFLHTPPAVPIDVVFFDMEEQGFRGSRAYLERIGPKRVNAFINLDVCGVGDTVTIAPRRHASAGPLCVPVREVQQSGRHMMRTITELPVNDAWSFEQADIPNITVCIMPADDVDLMRKLMTDPSWNPWHDKGPIIMTTMHHGPLDAVEIIEETAMNAVLAWMTDLIETWQKPSTF